MATPRKRDKFPLGFHKSTGQWFKKHEGKPYYFGTDQNEALKRYVVEWPRILNGENRCDRWTTDRAKNEEREKASSTQGRDLATTVGGK